MTRHPLIIFLRGLNVRSVDVIIRNNYRQQLDNGGKPTEFGCKESQNVCGWVLHSYMNVFRALRAETTQGLLEYPNWC
jgi:hypothetical protein